MGKKTLEDQINDFIGDWDCGQMNAFLRDIIPLIELYDVDEDDDWVKEAVGELDTRNVRLIRTVYLISKIADMHASKLVTIKYRYKDLWKKLEGVI